MGNYEPKPEAIFTAIKVGMQEMLLDVLKKGVDINLRNEQGFTPLMLAIEYDNTEIINLLIENGADIECRTQQYTPLMFAVQEGKFSIVQLLIRKGANINSATDEGLTVLMIAIRDNHINIVELLLKNGVDVDLKTKEGSTALMIAKQLNNEEIVVLIKKHLQIYDYGIPYKLRMSSAMLYMNDGMISEKILSIQNNIFPNALKSIPSPHSIKWHKYANLPNSSQVLAIDVFGTIKMSKFKDEIVNEICKNANINTGSDWNIEFEYEPQKNILNEPKSSQIDVRIYSDKTELILECKFTERKGGTCSQTRRIKKGANINIIQCNGNYGLQTNPVNDITSKCSLTGKGIKYWDYIPNIYGIDVSQDYQPCPFNNGNNQWMRNLSIIDYNKSNGKNSKFIIVYVESDKLPISESIKTDSIFGNYKPKPNYYSFLSYQAIIDIGLAVSKNDIDENQIWKDLLIHFDKKIQNYK